MTPEFFDILEDRPIIREIIPIPYTHRLTMEERIYRIECRLGLDAVDTRDTLKSDLYYVYRDYGYSNADSKRMAWEGANARYSVEDVHRHMQLRGRHITHIVK